MNCSLEGMIKDEVVSTKVNTVTFYGKQLQVIVNKIARMQQPAQAACRRAGGNGLSRRAGHDRRDLLAVTHIKGKEGGGVFPAADRAWFLTAPMPGWRPEYFPPHAR